MIDYARLRTDLLALALLAMAVFAALSLFSFNPADAPATVVYPPSEEFANLCGRVGAYFSYTMMSTIGWGSFFLLAGVVALTVQLFSRAPAKDPIVRIVGWMVASLSFSVGVHMLMPTFINTTLHGTGGYVGSMGTALLHRELSVVGSMVLLSTVFIAGLLLALDRMMLQLLTWIALIPWKMITLGWWLFVGQLYEKADPEDEEIEIIPQVTFYEDDTEPDEPQPVEEAPVADSNPSHEEVEDDDDFDHDEFAAQLDEDLAEPSDDLPFKVNPPVTIAPKSERDEVMAALVSADFEDEQDEYQAPSLDLLEDPEDFPYELLAKKAQTAAVTLEKTFQEFGLNVKVSEIDTGPVVTQFELALEPGLRVSKVTALADDLAIALRVPAVRVVSPIPGKNTVGVEVPNDTQVMVRLKELIEANTDKTDKMRLPLFLGKDVSGHPMSVDLAKMPHLLIAGRTGTGKSVCLNTLILSLLMTRRPDQVKMLMIDPKMVELSPYMRVPHLMHPVITDMKKAEAVLAWAVDKMEERYDLLAKCGVRHLDGYNKLGKEKVLQRMDIDPESAEADDVPESMPYIVIVADEMADMMMTSGKDVEGHIIRLAQKSRAVGIHLVLATQKPTVDVITGLIKSNLPARISFQVASRTDSRVVLDEMGAERLLGSGDMLYLAPGTSNLSRAQGTFVSDDEVNDVIQALSHFEPEYNPELTQLSTAGGGGKTGIEAIKDRDDLYEEAIEVVIREQRGSVSLLQRCLGVGYGRAARMIDYMAEDGIVGDYNGAQAREVLYKPEQWEEMKSGAEQEMEEMGV